MKIKLLSIVFLLISGFLIAQTANKNLEIKSFKLDNGLTVYLNEDHSVPNVLGAVIIKTGGKFDPADHTGTSHYLEHMMFKGTDMIGTVDYEKEKVILDDIEKRYEELATLTDPIEREKKQQEINKLSLEAGRYAIPNELDRILDNMGASMVNAFTSDEIVAYFNVFPKTQMRQWMMLYSHRFKNPVFRLFQSELETVFEEKNMYMDDFSTGLIEKFYENLYTNHPYGTQTVIGTAEHIKNPSLTNMRKMYETYYVANNMALIITGNFDTEETARMIKQYFSEWKKGDVPEYPEYPENQFEGVVKVVERLTPVKVGLLGFRTIPANHEDETALEVCSALLSNSSSTGYLDKLSLQGDMMEVMNFNDIRNDHGAMMVLYVPKIIGQSFKKAEKLVQGEIMKLHTEDIDDEFFNAVKLNLIKEHQMSLEDPTNRAFLIASLFTADKTWKEIMAYPEDIEKITKEDIKRVSSKYLGENYLSFQSKMGFPAKEKLEKPGFDPVIPENSEAKSEFAEKIGVMEGAPSVPEYIDFKSSLGVSDFKNGVSIYTVENKTNDIFDLSIKFKKGTNSDSSLEQLAEYLQLIGTKEHPLNEFNDKLQQIGCSYYIYADDNYFVINIDGFDKYFKESVGLVLSLLKTPEADDSKLKNLSRNAGFVRKFEKSSSDDLSSALFEYGLYEENSSYLRRMTTKEVGSLDSEELLVILENMLHETYNVHYSGTMSAKELNSFCDATFGFEPNANPSKFPIVFSKKKYAENTILFLDDPKSVQSRISFYVEGNVNSPKERAVAAAYNQYFGTGMSAIVFQEIREFRSMAYSAYAVYRNGLKLEDRGYLKGFIGTQSDKTIDAINVMDSLIHQMPMKENRIGSVQSALLLSVNSTKPTWRALSETVETWKLQGYKSDPRELQYKMFTKLSFRNIVEFYESNVKGKPMLITIVGNKKSIDMEELSKYGKIIEVDKKDIMN